MHTVVASTPGLAHTAWLSLRRLAATRVVVLGDAGQLAGATRMNVTRLPQDVPPGTLGTLLDGSVIFPAGERAHARALDAGLACLGHPEATLIRRLSDKAEYPALARECGFPTPALVAEGDRLLEKPRWGFGGIGVRPWNTGMDRAPDTVLQPYVGDTDLDVSLAAVDGSIIAITAEYPIDARMRAYVRHPQAEAAARAIVEGTGYTGLLHLDMRTEGDKLWVVDINPRIWATHWMAAALGMDFVAAFVASLQGRHARFKRKVGVFAPPWRFPSALRHGRVRPMAPFRAAAAQWSDPGVARWLRRDRGRATTPRPLPF